MSTNFTTSSEAEFLAEVAPGCSRQCGWFQSWQLGLLAVPIAALAALALVLWLQKPDYLQLLWQTPMGVKMLIAASATLAVGVMVYLGGCLVINRFVARPKWGTLATVLQMMLVLAWLVLFCLPSAYVILVGPAAIQIQQNLIAS